MSLARIANLLAATAGTMGIGFPEIRMPKLRRPVNQDESLRREIATWNAGVKRRNRRFVARQLARGRSAQ